VAKIFANEDSCLRLVSAVVMEISDKKEIQFLEMMLDNVSRYGVIIAPQSVFFKDNIVRDRILIKHTLKAVINMPKELFQPNASTHTAIAIFETYLPHNNSEVIFYDLKDDGFVLSKSFMNAWLFKLE
jgi:type I restriction-modification system DNA methylase subunit